MFIFLSFHITKGTCKIC